MNDLSNTLFYEIVSKLFMFTTVIGILFILYEGVFKENANGCIFAGFIIIDFFLGCITLAIMHAKIGALLCGIVCLLGIPLFKHCRKDRLELKQVLERQAKIPPNAFRLEGKKLYINKTSRYFADCLGVRTHQIRKTTQNKETIHIGAVSVGGVTTGGVYKTGGDYSERYINTDRYEMVFQQLEDINSKYIINDIEEIIFTEELVNKAKGTIIEEYLNGTKIELIDQEEISRAQIKILCRTLEDLTRRDYEMAKAYPTMKKCKDIIGFICDDPKIQQTKKVIPNIEVDKTQKDLLHKNYNTEDYNNNEW